MEIRNMCPHDVIVNGRVFLRSGTVIRVAEVTRVFGSFDGIDLVRKDFGEVVAERNGQVVPVPEKEVNVMFIVSGMVRQAALRTDFVSPGDPVRNEAGQIVGVKNLVVR